MPDFMPSYVYSDSDEGKIAEPKPVPAGCVTCDGCNGSGVYYGRGSVVNGKFVGFSGECYRCRGKGHQTAKDVRRNRYYDNNVRRFNV